MGCRQCRAKPIAGPLDFALPTEAINDAAGDP
jgi:hypothetical protein